MKKINVVLAFALVLAVSAVGCGKSNDQTGNPSGNPQVINPAAITPIPVGTPGNPGTGTLPRGCYVNGTATCAPCPTGYTDNGSACTYGGTVSNGCQAGYFYNGWYCQQVGYTYTCPYGTAWSNYYMSCVSATQPSNCKYTRYLAIFYTYVCAM